MDTIFERIYQIETSATKQEKAIIQYIRTHSIQDMVLLSITEFSEKAGVGEATLLRFCRKLRLKGYSEFRFFLSQSLSLSDQKPYSEADESLERMVSALQATHNLLDLQEIENAANFILNARHIYAMGSGNSGVAAQEFCNKLLRYGIFGTYIADNHFQLITTSLLDKQDVLVLFSVSGGTKDMQEIAKAAILQKVNLIIVTNYLKSPLAKYASALLYVVAKSAPLDSGSLVTKISQLYVIDVLSKTIYNHIQETAKKNLQRTALAIIDKEI